MLPALSNAKYGHLGAGVTPGCGAGKNQAMQDLDYEYMGPKDSTLLIFDEDRPAWIKCNNPVDIEQ